MAVVLLICNECDLSKPLATERMAWITTVGMENNQPINDNFITEHLPLVAELQTGEHITLTETFLPDRSAELDLEDSSSAEWVHEMYRHYTKQGTVVIQRL